MYRVENPVPRVALFHLVPPVPTEEARRAAAALQAVIKSIAPRKTVICTDVRAASAWPSETIDVFIQMMRGDNPLLERSGILYTEGGSMGLQILRIIREAGLQERRFGTHYREDLVRWFGEVLEPGELGHVRRFLGLRDDEVLGSLSSVQERMTGLKKRRDPRS